MPSLIDLIDQLVTSYGSSVIQKKYIALLKKEAVILEKKVAELNIENTILTNKIRALEMQSQNTSAQKKCNDCIAQQVYPIFGQEQPDYFPLNERELNILIKVSIKEKISVKEISLSLDVLEQIVYYYLKELETQDMVIHIPAPLDGDLWSLSSKGRKYLINHGIIA